MSLALIGFLGHVNLYCQRTNLSVAMVCMVNNTALDEQEAVEGGNYSTTIMPTYVPEEVQCPGEDRNSTTVRNDDCRKKWKL